MKTSSAAMNVAQSGLASADDESNELTWNDILYDGGHATWTSRSSIRWLTISVCIIGILGKLPRLNRETDRHIPFDSRQFPSRVYAPSATHAQALHLCLSHGTVHIQQRHTDVGDCLRTRRARRAGSFQLRSHVISQSHSIEHIRSLDLVGCPCELYASRSARQSEE